MGLEHLEAKVATLVAELKMTAWSVAEVPPHLPHA